MGHLGQVALAGLRREASIITQEVQAGLARLMGAGVQLGSMATAVPGLRQTQPTEMTQDRAVAEAVRQDLTRQAKSAAAAAAVCLLQAGHPQQWRPLLALSLGAVALGLGGRPAQRQRLTGAAAMAEPGAAAAGRVPVALAALVGMVD